MSERAFVENYADGSQQRYGNRVVRRREAASLEAFRSVLRTAEGRHMYWDVLARCGVFRSIWQLSAAIHYNAGQQDIGHWLMGKLLEADEQAYELMHREARARERRQNVDVEAQRTPSITEE
ncbi:MAG TPA: hypothetical protein VKB41_05025 [Steroidobacteraceae bacterium]|nr:hypothetical protein [Steroidobacteraceae bacterium]